MRNVAFMGATAAATLKLPLLDNRANEALPQRELYKLLRAFYYNNDLYGLLRDLGMYLDEPTLRALKNPAKRAAEFYPAVIWPGALPQALPISVEGNEAIVPAIRQLWVWSNWAIQKQISVRTAAITGNTYLRVGQEETKKRVVMQRIEPEFVTDQDTDIRGYLTYIRIDMPLTNRMRPPQSQAVVELPTVGTPTYTEVWDSNGGRIWVHNQGAAVAVSNLGEPTHKIEFSQLGIDFIPVVHTKHLDIGDDHGLGAFTTSLDKIDELNRLATQFHKLLFRHNTPTWTLSPNGTDQMGRPLPAPRLPTNDAGEEQLDFGGEKVIKLPGNSALQTLVPPVDYMAAREAIKDYLAELESDMPELIYSRLRDFPEVSGIALRTLLSPALSVAQEVRGNHEAGLIRAHQMALTIGAKVGAWKDRGYKDVGLYAAGDFDHYFPERPFIQLGRADVAELAAAETAVGIPLKTSLRRSGWTEEMFDQMDEDKTEDQQNQTKNFGVALLQAQDRLNGGGGSNGMENPAEEQTNPFSEPLA